jgi:hypothetical protein
MKKNISISLEPYEIAFLDSLREKMNMNRSQAIRLLITGARFAEQGVDEKDLPDEILRRLQNG